VGLFCDDEAKKTRDESHRKKDPLFCDDEAKKTLVMSFIIKKTHFFVMIM